MADFTGVAVLLSALCSLTVLILFVTKYNRERRSEGAKDQHIIDSINTVDKRVQGVETKVDAVDEKVTNLDRRVLALGIEHEQNYPKSAINLS